MLLVATGTGVLVLLVSHVLYMYMYGTCTGATGIITRIVLTTFVF